MIREVSRSCGKGTKINLAPSTFEVENSLELVLFQLFFNVNSSQVDVSSQSHRARVSKAPLSHQFTRRPGILMETSARY